VRQISVAGVDVRALRVSYLGELGWELHADATDLGRLFDALEAAGTPHGLGFYGAYAANSMRLEKGYRGWGADLTTERSPLESGLGAFTKAEGRAFPGRGGLLTRSNDWHSVLLQVEEGPTDPFYAHPVWQGGRIIGIVTSGGFGHRVGHALALALLREPLSGEPLCIEILGQRRTATVLARPPFDPDNARLRG
jgi:dimethylglycine dehydrogenase